MRSRSTFRFGAVTEVPCIRDNLAGRAFYRCCVEAHRQRRFTRSRLDHKAHWIAERWRDHQIRPAAGRSYQQLDELVAPDGQLDGCVFRRLHPVVAIPFRRPGLEEDNLLPLRLHQPPLVGTERGRRQPFLVVEIVLLGGATVGVAHGHGIGHRRTRDHHIRTIDHCIGPSPLFIVAANRERTQLAILNLHGRRSPDLLADHQPAPNVVEFQADLIPLDLQFPVERAADHQILLAVQVAQRPQSKALAHVELVHRVNATADINGHGHAGVGDLQALEQFHAGNRQAYAVLAVRLNRLRDAIGIHKPITGKLHKIHGEVALIPDLAPAAYQGPHLAVVARVAAVPFALVPERALDAIGGRRFPFGQVDRRERDVIRLPQHGFIAPLLLQPGLQIEPLGRDGGGNHCAAKGDFDQSHRHARFLDEAPCKVKAGAGEGRRRVRRADRPRPGHITARLPARRDIGGHQATQEGQIGGGNILLGVAFFQRKLHVRLPAADPDVADQHVFDRDRVLASDDQLLADGIHLHGRQPEHPLALRVSVGRRVGAAHLDRHLFARLRRPPDRHRKIALQHCVIAKDRRHRYIGPHRVRASPNCQQCENDCQEIALASAAPWTVRTRAGTRE